MNRIDAKFSGLAREGRAALMPYLPLGYPNRQISRDLILAVADAGADIMELGIPFSDPLADGPTIQNATQIALKNGMTLGSCLEEVGIARNSGVSIPIVLMGYYNPILRYGVEEFVQRARGVGADGLIVPDLPLEEAELLHNACELNSLDLIYLAAPTSNQERLEKIGAKTRGFMYLVSISGVTGARDSLPVEVGDFVARARRVTTKPLCIGFGISSPATARRVAEIADGAIVGSALVEKIGDPSDAVVQARKYVNELKEVIAGVRRPITA